jgi:DUF1365 family protein
VQVWIDPDRPGDLFDRSPWWSTTRPSPGRFRRADYLDGTDAPFGDAIRDALTDALGHHPTGPLRTLTQPRIWGWLFNPLTIHLAWDATDRDPVAALLEVTNTPWKERHLYPVALATPDAGHHRWAVEARFRKVLHVSPFLDENHTYRFALARPQNEEPGIEIALDVLASSAQPEAPSPGGDGDLNPAKFEAGPEGDDPRPAVPILTTRLQVDLDPDADSRALRAVLKPHRLPTHRVSVGIHRQALALWRKRVPFVPHPRKRS